ncbi:Alpha-glucuronidase A [Cryoendolithus antarcticus]|uniref:Alpha-glucuronidase n=1 Tax=Cryoendolithus antarcticus TaxID=1507870 RepID=A0A1V8SMU5_9PEZI|nr:Alpha-glucuronidase A [Cryoendolithus antarcticus]
MLLSLLLLPLGLVAAETGIDAWLRYAPIPEAHKYAGRIPTQVIALNSSDLSPVLTGAKELEQGISSIFGQSCNVNRWHGGHRGGAQRPTSSIVIGTVAEYSSYAAKDSKKPIPKLVNDGFYLDTTGREVLILGSNERGALYGAFEYLSLLAQGNVTKVAYASNPEVPIRWINQWDNLRDGGTHGSVERGYGGKSLFFWNGEVRPDLTRAAQYARLLASIGINAVVVNNVNANETILNSTNLDGVARIADVFRPYGVQLGLSLYFASPKALGALNTFDPLDQSVINWWTNITDEIYERVPDFAGYLVKANSEGQPGPLTYNRTLAQGANLFAKALQPHGGVCVFRAFVYDSTTINETVWADDRANAAVDFFDGLDDQFMDNVVVQIKYGPIDFQVREAVSPLFSHLRQTATSVELQITPEYLGQNVHLVYLAPLWKEILDFDLRVDGAPSTVKSIVNGTRFKNTLGGFAGVAGAGNNQTWLGSHLAMSNLYAYGKLAWNADADSVEMLQAWTKLTFSHDQKVIDTVTSMSMASWPAYEGFSGNLGIQTLTNILNGHYGPDPQSQENNPYGQWYRADATTIGMDRTVSNGTGNAGQYPPEVAAAYESVDTTPENLLLWFHHLPYTHVLKSGETIIQHFYNAHYNGSAVSNTFPAQWESLKPYIDTQRYEEQLFRLVYAAGHSLVWRDSINNYFFNVSSIADEQNRVLNHPYRIEAESMELEGYHPYLVHPFHAASGTYAIVTDNNSTQGSATASVPFPAGKYDVAVNYYDQVIGNATWELYLDDSLVGEWKGDFEYSVGSARVFYIDGQSAIRKTFKGVDVKANATVKIVGKGDGMEPAPVDYISFLPQGVVD